MTKTIFQPGTKVTSAFLNAINNPVFDGQDLDGHRGKISDAELADDGIKSVVGDFLGGLEVTTSTGSNLVIGEGSYINALGDRVDYPGGTLSLPSNGTFYVQLDSNGAIVALSSVLPVSTLLAKVTTVSGSVNQLVDLRQIRRLGLNPLAVRVFGGLGGSGSYRVSNVTLPGIYGDETVVADSTQISGEYFFKNFTVESGCSLIVDGGATIYCSGNVDISGIVIVIPRVSGGRGFQGTIMVPTDIWSSSGNGIGGASGHNLTAASPYSYTLSNAGSGGASPYIKTRLQGSYTLSDINENVFVNTSSGGNGGGYFILEVAGSVTVSGSINCPGGDSGTPTIPTGLNLATQRILISGGGGGSGGLIWLKSRTSITLTPSTLLSVRGGRGGIGYLSTNIETSFRTQGGGGGSGGWVVIQSPNNNLIGFSETINLNLSGGLAGNTYGTGGNTLSGSNGASYADFGGTSNQPGFPGKFVNIASLPI